MIGFTELFLFPFINLRGMKIRSMLAASLLAFFLSSCGITDVAKNVAAGAADATACKAFGSTIKSISSGYQSGLVDSGLITRLDDLVGEQARSLLTSGLARDLNSLADELGKTTTVEDSKEKIQKITDSIKQRCADAGVNLN